MVELFANSRDPDQTQHSSAADLGLHCLPNTLLGVSRLQWSQLLRISLLAFDMLYFSVLQRKQLWTE